MSVTGRTLRRLALLVAVPVATGCYSYTRVPIEAVPANQSLRLVVTSAGAAELRDAVGNGEAVPSFVAEMTGRENGSLLLRVPLAGATSGGTSIGQVIRVPEREILSVERRDLSVGKTAGLLTAAAGAGAVLVIKIIDAGGNPGDEGEEPDFSLAWLRIPIG